MAVAEEPAGWQLAHAVFCGWCVVALSGGAERWHAEQER
jgi:hypothetical protein